MRRGAVGVGDQLGGVQERLGGDAADVQADAAEALVALDQVTCRPEVGRAESGRVAARAGSEDEHLRVQSPLSPSCASPPRAHSSARRMSAAALARWAQKRAAAAPSITRWS